MVEFRDWNFKLEEQDLPVEQKNTYGIIIRWYLSYCRRGRAQVDVHSARAFIRQVNQEKSPPKWQLEQWKEGFNWFFRSARDLPTSKKSPGQSKIPDGILHDPSSRWRQRVLLALKVKNYAYRTEQSYLQWVHRFAKFHK